ncbi:hypothetical protein PG913_10075 [Tenacibaculum pacificus]|uniref:hypothetical protein n=1 Tax=Tenacibaculum pacificus TaxID=3018314 RepID=UPI0022F3E97C|nr:hypothetical protein [Tenacibaculum pacificus]WBX73209.1 hypothetical protein PG913_10075 [Tenacibaculum pacificus]
MKKIDLGKREELYPNYLSLGFGTKMTPFVEAYIRNETGYGGEFGAHLKFLLSADPVEEIPLSSTYYNVGLNLFYAQNERYYSWKAGVNGERNKHNWYGLPTNIFPTEATVDNKATISRIEPEQAYNYFKVFGEIKMDDSSLEEVKMSASLFSDILESSEFLIDGNALFKFPLDNIYRELNDLHINTTLSYLGTSFENNYETQEQLKYSFFNFGVHPTYKFLAYDISVKIGAKSYFSMDMEKSENQFLIYPDIEISYPIVKDALDIFIGASGDLKTNTYHSLATKNPYISPTQNLLQTNKYEAFGGIRGKLKHQFSYNIKGSYADIENNPFFALNQSKSDGTNNAGTDAFSFLGYEYGNSFKTEYDDIKAITFFGELAFDGIKNLSIGLNGEFNQFTLTNEELEPWNTPEMKGEFFGTYKTGKWFAGTNLFFVGERKGKLYNILPEKTFTTVNLESYFDINFNGGYHFNDSFSVFLNLNNVLNTNYQRFNSFNVQGFQAMAGLTWKFDTIL